MKPSKLSHFPKSRKLHPRELPDVYATLRHAFGTQGWWPAQTAFEVIIGAILTQNTAWTNVEKAMAHLKRARCLTPKRLQALSARRLARLIRPAGYFNVKAKRIHSFLDFLFARYDGDLKQLFRQRGDRLRRELLAVNGIGPETADSILLYAANKPYFVIDAYTKRIFSRHHLENAAADYHHWQALFTRHLPRRRTLYNDYHAQIVQVGKSFCRAKALCDACPMRVYL